MLIMMMMMVMVIKTSSLVPQRLTPSRRTTCKHDFVMIISYQDVHNNHNLVSVEHEDDVDADDDDYGCTVMVMLTIIIIRSQLKKCMAEAM